MAIRIFSSSIHGIDATLVEVEVDSSPGIHAFTIVGLPDKAVEESKDRIGSAIRNSGLTPPTAKNNKIVVNLAPADVRKEGPSYDLPIAIGYLLQTKQIKFDTTKRLFSGELSLDGSIRPTAGILASALLAKHIGFEEVIVPIANAAEAAAVSGIRVIGVSNLSETIAHLVGQTSISPTVKNAPAVPEHTVDDSFWTSIRGQETAKRGLIVAAAGGHNILMKGVPGSGKTLLAKALRELLPNLSPDESLEVTKIYSAVGLTTGQALLTQRPFRSPHHTTSASALIGGGSWPRPGEISLAHRGLLFLDELPEFPKNVLESLRQPLEDGHITVSRASGSLTLPAKFTLVAAMNPCPCGNFGDQSATCVCSPFSVVKYAKKLSGPLLDRIDIQLFIPRENIQPSDNSSQKPKRFESVSTIRASIARARQLQQARLAAFGIFTNAEINYKDVDDLCRLSPDAQRILDSIVNTKRLSLRAYHKIKKLARTIADLDQSDHIKDAHLAEAITLRLNDRITDQY